MNTHTNVNKKRQNGSSLIEVLIAILIFGLGMLGMVGLLAATAKYQSGNQSRVQISNSIEGLGERIRSNIVAANGFTLPPAAVAATGYVYVDTFAAQEAVALSTLTGGLNCMTTNCTALQREAYDIRTWRAQLKQSMPNGAGIIRGNVRNGFDVTVMWFDKTAVKGDDGLFTDEEQSNQVCPNTAIAPNSSTARFCCPQIVAAGPGVRCYNTKIIP
jgi:type IV pilus assembly protein PilV